MGEVANDYRTRLENVFYELVISNGTDVYFENGGLQCLPSLDSFRQFLDACLNFFDVGRFIELIILFSLSNFPVTAQRISFLEVNSKFKILYPENLTAVWHIAVTTSQNLLRCSEIDEVI